MITKNASKEVTYTDKELVREHISISALIVAVIYGALVNFLAYGLINPLFVSNIENIKIGGRAILAIIVGTGLFSVRLGFIYAGILLLVVSALMLIFHVPGSHYLSALTAAYLLLLAIIGPSLMMLIVFVVSLLLTLKAWDHIELVNIVKKTLKEVRKE
ncbi:MAG: hypothetical protein J7K58_05820 [Euryarchaeota archaeon]|nr:hypothetical protein [Euryarchaeota archaeon]